MLPQDQCITAAKYSYKAHCTSSALVVDAYVGRKCEGSAIARTHNPINTCMIDFDSTHTENFIENLCHAGPAPPTPAPTPAPPTNTFIQMTCQDSLCSVGCVNSSYPVGQCLTLAEGGSATAQCTATALVLTEYPLTQDCSGFSIPNSMPLATCLQDGANYIENFCSAGSARARSGDMLVVNRRRNF